jgi:hypothetical protein
MIGHDGDGSPAVFAGLIHVFGLQLLSQQPATAHNQSRLAITTCPSSSFGCARSWREQWTTESLDHRACKTDAPETASVTASATPTPTSTIAICG